MFLRPQPHNYRANLRSGPALSPVGGAALLLTFAQQQAGILAELPGGSISLPRTSRDQPACSRQTTRGRRAGGTGDAPHLALPQGGSAVCEGVPVLLWPFSPEQAGVMGTETVGTREVTLSPRHLVAGSTALPYILLTFMNCIKQM